MNDPTFKLFAPAAGQMFSDADGYLEQLGNPVGVAAYRPTYARGENNVHNYLGECGIPLEPSGEYDSEAKTILLAEGAADDDAIEAKMKESLSKGADVVVTSGFVRKMGERFKEFANVSYSSRKAIVSKYANSKNHGLSINGLYNLPVEVLDAYRDIFSNTMGISLSAPAKVQLYVYDNDTAIVRSDLEYVETITLNIGNGVKKVTDIVTGRTFEVINGSVTWNATPAINYVLKIEK